MDYFSNTLLNKNKGKSEKTFTSNKERRRATVLNPRAMGLIANPQQIRRSLVQQGLLKSMHTTTFS
jgi:hypothetical protein